MIKRFIVNPSLFSKGELNSVLLMFSLMLVVNYVMSAFGASAYSDSGNLDWPDLFNLRYIVFVQLLLIAPGFLFSRPRAYVTVLLSVHFIILFILLAIYLTTGTIYCEEILNLIYDTTWEEIKGFAVAYFSFNAFCILVVTVFCIVVL